MWPPVLSHGSNQFSWHWLSGAIVLWTFICARVIGLVSWYICVAWTFSFFCFVIYLMMALYCSWGQRPSSAIYGWGMAFFEWLWWPNSVQRQTWPTFPDIHLTVEGKPQKYVSQEIDLTRIWIQAGWMRGNDITPWPQLLSDL